MVFVESNSDVLDTIFSRLNIRYEVNRSKFVLKWIESNQPNSILNLLRCVKS